MSTDAGTQHLAGASTNGVVTEAAIGMADGLLTLDIPVDYTFTTSGDRSGEFQFVGQLDDRGGTTHR